MARLLFVAGEPSGDLHASGVVRWLLSLRPGWTVEAVGGPLMAGAGAKILYDIDELSVVGLFEVLRHLPDVRRVFGGLSEGIRKRRWDAVVLVDYPGMNLRLAKVAASSGVPAVYYIAPQVWAWGAWRVGTMRAALAEVLVIFKFEEEFLRARGVPAKYVGHPLLDELPERLPKSTARARLGLPEWGPALALLPGSRRGEIRTLLPRFLAAAALLKKSLPDLAVVAACTEGVDRGWVEGLCAEVGATAFYGRTHECLCAADAALIAAGTATLEAGLLEVPSVVSHRLSLPSYLMAKALVRSRHVGLANIVAGEEVFPELVQGRAGPERLARALRPLLADPSAAAAARDRLKHLRERLGEAGGQRAAAEAIIACLERTGRPG